VKAQNHLHIFVTDTLPPPHGPLDSLGYLQGCGDNIETTVPSQLRQTTSTSLAQHSRTSPIEPQCFEEILSYLVTATLRSTPCPPAMILPRYTTDQKSLIFI